MDTGASDRDELLRRQIKAMPSRRFEQLIFELARREDDKVRRLTSPDGGADTVRPPEALRRSEVWQAKHYPENIDWGACEGSLNRSIERWQPSVVTFAFPRDLSEQLEQAFQDRLVTRGTEANVEVVLWNLSEIVRRLDANPDLKVSYFGKEQESILEGLDRMIKSGGQLESWENLVDRAKTIGEWTRRQDTDFEYHVGTGSATAPEPDWPKLPYITIQVGDEVTRVRVDAWAREGTDVDAPAFTFTDDEAGRQARSETVRALARGEEAVITNGARLWFRAPEALRELAPDPSAFSGGRLRIPPSEPITLELEAVTTAGVVARQLDMRPVPPAGSRTAAFAGYAGDVLIELSIELRERPTVAIHLGSSAHFTRSASENAQSAELVCALLQHERLALRSEELFPGTGQLVGQFSAADEDGDTFMQMDVRRRFYGDVAFIERELGVELPIPNSFERVDLDSAATMADVLRTRQGTATFDQASGVVDDPLEIPDLPRRFEHEGPVRRMVTYSLFGQELELGLADYEIPPLKVVDVIPHGQEPSSPARVVLEPEDSNQMTFRLMNELAPL
jgi:hypothetical protein